MISIGIDRNGAYAEYVSVPATLVISLPSSWSFEHGAQLGVACFTACQCLYQYLGLPTPLDDTNSLNTEFILIWSGATSTGQYMIQLAKLAGLRIISTSSPQNFDRLKSLGAELVFDYSDSFTYKHILEVTQRKLMLAVDCHSAGTSLMQVSKSFGKDGGKRAVLLPVENRNSNVTTEFILAYSIFGKVSSNYQYSFSNLELTSFAQEISFPFVFEQHPDHYENAVKYAALITKVISTVPIQPISMKLYQHGLASVSEGLQYMQDGKVKLL